MKITTNEQLTTALNSLDGGTIYLEGDFGPISITKQYSAPLHIFADRAFVKGLTISGANVRWYNGRIEASGGSQGVARAGYGINLTRCRDVLISGVNVRNSDRGFVLGACLNTTISDCDVSVRQDGIIASQGENIYFLNNYFHDFYPKPTTCTIGEEVRTGLSKSNCEALGGVWKDGDHSDAIQIRNGMKNVYIVGNIVYGISQGIGQMDATTDLPIDNILILNNDVRVTGFHSITMPRCTNLVVVGNTTQQLTGRRSPLRLESTAIAYDNNVLSP